MNNFAFRRTTTVADTIALMEPTAANRVIAGGTNLIDLLKYVVTEADLLVDINGIESMRTVDQLDQGGVRIGALLTNAQTAYHPIIETEYPLLSKAILAGASAQIRNMATNGGNLLQRTRCYYFYDPNAPCNKRTPGSGCSAVNGYNRIHAILGHSEQCIAVFPSDMCVALAALDATVNVVGPHGNRIIPFQDFHRLPGDTPHLDNNLQYDELITGIDLPKQGFGDYYSYLKLRDRSSYSFALVAVASAFTIEDGLIRDARIALGGVSHKPWRISEAEQFLIDKIPDRKYFETAAQMVTDGAVAFTHNKFKIDLAQRAIVRNCLMALNPKTQRPGAKPSL
ncbi:MAG: xanthine dehydrogenase family protein subunit [Sphingobacterium sp.]|nr:xanthine dehydrogenase family protein subunit [Sphingobacterium sp.]